MTFRTTTPFRRTSLLVLTLSHKQPFLDFSSIQGKTLTLTTLTLKQHSLLKKKKIALHPATPSFTDSSIIFSAKQAADSTGVLPPVIRIRHCLLQPRYMAHFTSSFGLVLYWTVTPCLLFCQFRLYSSTTATLGTEASGRSIEGG